MEVAAEVCAAIIRKEDQCMSCVLEPFGQTAAYGIILLLLGK